MRASPYGYRKEVRKATLSASTAMVVSKLMSEVALVGCVKNDRFIPNEDVCRRSARQVELDTAEELSLSRPLSVASGRASLPPRRGVGLFADLYRTSVGAAKSTMVPTVLSRRSSARRPALPVLDRTTRPYVSAKV